MQYQQAQPTRIRLAAPTTGTVYIYVPQATPGSSSSSSSKRHSRSSSYQGVAPQSTAQPVYIQQHYAPQAYQAPIQYVPAAPAQVPAPINIPSSKSSHRASYDGYHLHPQQQQQPAQQQQVYYTYSPVYTYHQPVYGTSPSTSPASVVSTISTASASSDSSRPRSILKSRHVPSSPSGTSPSSKKVHFA